MLETRRPASKRCPEILVSPSPAASSRRPPGAPRILLVRLSAIGDCLHALPVVHQLRRQIPDAFLGWAIESPGLSLLEGHPEVDRFHRFPRGDRGRIRALRRFRRELREVGYDIAVDVQGLTKSGLVAWLSGAEERVGFADEGSRELNRFFVNRRLVPSPARVHVIDRNLALLDALGLDVPELGSAQWVFPRAEPEDDVVRFLATFGGDPFVALNPGAAWSTKQWPVASFTRLARRLATELGAAVAVIWGSDEERRAAEEIRDGAAAAAVRLAPRTDLRQLGALLARASLMVSGDTGPLHLAAALRVPTVAPFGPTSPERNGPYGDDHVVLVDEQPLECRPCWARRCSRGDLACLQRIEADRVFGACATTWEKAVDPS